MTYKTFFLRAVPIILIACSLPLEAVQDTTKAQTKTQKPKTVAVTTVQPKQVSTTNVVDSIKDTTNKISKVKAIAAPVAAVPDSQLVGPLQPASTTITVKSEPASPITITAQIKDTTPLPVAKAETTPVKTAPVLQTEPINTVEKMRQEAARLRMESRSLHELADTLNQSADDAEKKADEVSDKAENLTDNLSESDARRVAHHVKLEMERMKRLIQADVERIKKLHGIQSTNDTLYTLQADSLDSILARVSTDTTETTKKQKALLEEINTNSASLLAKAREMSQKARELEDAADKREDLADEWANKADKLAEEQNTTPLSKRFPLHFGFQVRVSRIGDRFNDEPDLMLFHNLHLTYSITPHMEAGFQDISLYWQQTVFGTRYAVTGSPALKLSFFATKRYQLGAMAGASVQARMGCNRPTRYSVAPFAGIYNEFWIRHHFSISPVLRCTYAAYGPYYGLALSDHSGVLPEGAVWLDFGLGFNFNF
jgi:hypothetical protein